MADNLLSSFLPDDRASFGIFPQMKPKRRLQDPTGAANVPLSVLRGYAAGTAGLPGDIEGLARAGLSQLPPQLLTAFPALRAFGIGSRADPTPQLPTTEFYNEYLPGASLNETPTGKAFTTAGNLLGGVGSTNIAGLGVKGAAAGVKALGPTAGRMAEGYLQRQGLMPNIVPEAPQVPLGSMIEKPQAPVSELGFYSAAEQAALNLPRKSGTGESFLNDLMKGQDVKKDELSWMGLDDYLKGKPNVTKQEVQDFISANRVDVREVRLGDREVKLPSTIGLLKREEILNKYQPKLDALYAEDANYANLTPQRYEELGQEIRALERQRDVEADAAYRIPPLPQLTPTKYERYQLPGGENYREILLTLPAAGEDVQKLNQISMQLHGKPYTEIMADTSEMAKMRLAVKREYKNQFGESGQNAQDRGMYRSSHFNEPNILAHMRVNDRVDADGKKMLLIEEIQSDWHQAGREKGYQGKGTLKELPDNYFVQEIKTIDGDTMYVVRDNNNPGVVLNKDYNKQSAINGVINELNATSAGGVPDAPFKDTWHQLALKRALKYAADNGYDRVGLTTGRQQADRYQLSKQISEVHYSGTNFKAYDLDGNEAISRTGVKPEDLAGLIGKEPAKKLLEQPKQGTLQSLTGQNLDVGGEGMKKYYDEIYPAFFAKQGKKYNAKTGETRIKTQLSLNDNQNNIFTWDPRQQPDPVDFFPGKGIVRYIDISPEMRGGVKKGQPLFTAAPIGGIGVGAAMQDQQQNSLNSFIQ